MDGCRYVLTEYKEFSLYACSYIHHTLSVDIAVNDSSTKSTNETNHTTQYLLTPVTSTRL